MTVVIWPAHGASGSVAAVPKIRAEDRQFALRLGNVLQQLRATAGWTQAKAAEELRLNEGTLGRWERGDYAPKGYDLGRLFRGYQRFGAQWEWFFDPPEVVEINPVKAKLDELAELGTIEAHRMTRPAPKRRPRARPGPASEPRRRSA